MRITGLALALVFLALTGRDATAALPPARINVVERFELPKDERSLVLLPVKLREKQYLFIVDTGATCTVFDSSLIPLLGKALPEQKIEEGKGATLKAFESPDARVGKMSLRRLPLVLALDMKPIREATGDEVFGILGMDFLQPRVVRIDFDRGEALFLRSAGTDPGQAMPFRLDNCSRPVVDVQLPGLDKSEQFLLDTGCGGIGSGALRRKAYEALVKSKRIKSVGESFAQTFSGQTVSTSGRLDAFTWGNFRHEGLLFNVDDDNILGMNYWSRYVATFDFPGKRMYVKKGTRFSQPDLLDLSGVSVSRRDGKSVVDSVAAESPSGRAGVRPRDVIVSIDGERAEKVHMQTLLARLCADGKKVRLRVSREGKEHDVEFMLRDWRQIVPAEN
jgi:hypothetical protein